MIDFIKRFCKKCRGDINALLLIAFVFQLFTPILVFAAEAAHLDDYEEALRSSICQVMLEEIQANEKAKPSETDAFVCDWCVLCTIKPSLEIQSAPVLDVTLYGRYVPYPQTLEVALLPQVKGNLSQSRAPPHF